MFEQLEVGRWNGQFKIRVDIAHTRDTNNFFSFVRYVQIFCVRDVLHKFFKFFSFEFFHRNRDRFFLFRHCAFCFLLQSSNSNYFQFLLVFPTQFEGGFGTAELEQWKRRRLLERLQGSPIKTTNSNALTFDNRKFVNIEAVLRANIGANIKVMTVRY